MSVRRFRPSVPMTVATVAFVALTVSLGNWQLRRAEDKEARQAALDARSKEPPVALSSRPVRAEDLAWRTVRVRGEYAAAKTILLDNRVLKGRVGYEVLTPMRIEGGDMWVVVNRGWVPAGATRAELPKIATPAGVQAIEGVALVPGEKVFELEKEVPVGPVWQHFLMERYAGWSGLALQPVMLQQTNDAADGLMRDWQRPASGSEKNRGYALQWYAFSILSLILYVALNFKRKPAAA